MSKPSDHYSIEVDRTACSGSGVCASYAPATFTLDDETKAVVIDVSGDPPSLVRAAADACPTGAVSITLHTKPDH